MVWEREASATMADWCWMILMFSGVTAELRPTNRSSSMMMMMMTFLTHTTKIKMMDLLLTNCDCVPAPVSSIYTMSPGHPSCSIVARIYLVRSPDITR